MFISETLYVPNCHWSIELLKLCTESKSLNLRWDFKYWNTQLCSARIEFYKNGTLWQVTRWLHVLTEVCFSGIPWKTLIEKFSIYSFYHNQLCLLLRQMMANFCNPSQFYQKNISPPILSFLLYQGVKMKQIITE